MTPAVPTPPRHLPPLTVLLASPRGFCAGVDRAIAIVDEALTANGAPVYVRHEIVHNRHVVEELERKGAVFVEELDEVPDGAVVVFSAHGVPKSVPAEAKRRRLVHADATCPLVSKSTARSSTTTGRAAPCCWSATPATRRWSAPWAKSRRGSVLLVETVADARRVEVPDPARVAFSTQTTLSVADTAGVVAALKERFPGLAGPRNEDICYATTNRQRAVAAIAPRVDLLLVVGASNSSNSVRLVEVARQAGCPRAELIKAADAIDWGWFAGVGRVGVSAGASAPEILVEGVLAACRERFDVRVEEVRLAEEHVTFRSPPPPLRRAS